MEVGRLSWLPALGGCSGERRGTFPIVVQPVVSGDDTSNSVHALESPLQSRDANDTDEQTLEPMRGGGGGVGGGTIH